MALAATLDTAVAQATQAEALAHTVNTDTAQLNRTYNQRVASAGASPLLYDPAALAASLPTTAEMAAADQLGGEAAQATQMMAAANAQARAAWAAATGAFDAASAQAPSVRAAVSKARSTAAAKYKSDHHHNALLGTLDLLASGLLPIASVGADIVTDGGAGAATPEEAGAEEALVADGLANLTGGIDQAAVAASEESAAATTADGTTLDSQVARDVAAGPETAGSVPEAAATIGKPEDFDPASLTGQTREEIESRIPSDWVRTQSKSGGGEVFSDPANPGRQIRIMPGYGEGVRPDPLTAGPYTVVSQNGVVTKWPLAGNPTLP